ncbi:sugar ABC transporter ATP-binding protein [Ensifer soli]|uniref:sugar ABC transporter ATP-binding protein n=1 Tax=Ciceribacter sp. sgz301302 TaxID=3342379 RepID=UPI0035BAD175
MDGSSILLEMRNIEKSFATVPVLRKASFSLRRGEVHALMGGNGAGKSTLMKILTGVYTRDGGSILIDGVPVDITDATSARDAGIAMIFQEFSLIPTLSVAQNIFLKREFRRGSVFINDREAIRRARAILDELGVDIDPTTPVSELSVGYAQMVEIAKALSQNARILIMDEPTASLSESETASLFELVGRLRRSGISVIYISHRMAEIFALCDRVTVMRDGDIRFTRDCKDVTVAQLVESMLGATPATAFAWQDRGYEPAGKPLLTVRNLSLPPRVVDVSFDIHPGEIVGLAGLMGSGRTEIAEAIFGLRAAGGVIEIDGRPVASQGAAIAAGIALVPEDRRRLGLVLDHSVRDNLVLPNLAQFTRAAFVQDRGALAMVTQMIARLAIKTDGPDKAARLLSGGNQQKIVLGKWLARDPRLLILDEPTIGVDIGAKAEIARTVRAMADQGVAVLVISSELEELLVMSDRLLILHNGKIFQQLQRKNIDSEEELHHAIQGHHLGSSRDAVATA